MTGSIDRASPSLSLTALAVGALAAVLSTGCPSEPVSDDAATLPDAPSATPDAATVPDAFATPGTDAGRDAAVAADDAFATPDAFVEADAFLEPDAFVLPSECTTTITSADAGTFVELCPIAGSVEHFRIEGVAVPGGHAYAQLAFGFATAPASGTGALGDDQLRVTLYGGGPPPPALVQAELGTLDGLGAVYTNALSTVCGDVHDGGADSTPYVVLWVDGARGADCDDATTLTLDSAYDSELVWDGPRAVNKATPTFYFQAAAVTTYPTITLYDDPVLEGTALAESTLTCETPATAVTTWQPLCTPAAGTAHHVRIEDISATANSSYSYFVLGGPADVTASPSPATAAGDRRFIATMGRNHMGVSWTWFRFNGGTTTQFAYEAPTGTALYTAGPSDVCMDFGAIDGHARVLFWATGAGGADCEDWSTLTAANARYDSSTDAASGAIWNALFEDTLVDYVKTNNATVSVGRVVRFTDAAVL